MPVMRASRGVAPIEGRSASAISSGLAARAHWLARSSARTSFRTSSGSFWITSGRVTKTCLRNSASWILAPRVVNQQDREATRHRCVGQRWRHERDVYLALLEGREPGQTATNRNDISVL